MEEADAGQHDGQISPDEWTALLSDPAVKLWLASMELDTSDAKRLFSLIDSSNDGQITLEELTVGVAKLKGAARSLDVQTLMRDHAALRESVEGLITVVTRLSQETIVHQDAMLDSGFRL